MKTYGNSKKDRELELREKYVARRKGKKPTVVDSLSKASDGMAILLDASLTPEQAVTKYLARFA